MAESRRMVDGIKIVDYRELRIQRLLGRGAFGEVFVAQYPDPTINNPVVIKRIHEPVDDNARQLFMKEAKLLNGLHHENIVRMHGMCKGPLVIIMEYVFFDFKPFLNRQLQINTVDKFLSEITKLSESDCELFDHLIPAIAGDITRGILYLHNLEIAHRDLKPMNVLISNQHYCHLQDSQEIKRLKSERPVVCKLADFGESRSQLLQTNRVNDPGTNSGWRGTIPFMAPEILLPEGLPSGKKLSLEDLKKVDIWALGLVFYCLVNPSVTYPYQRDVENNFQNIMILQRQRKRPSADPRYQLKHTTVWSRVHGAFEACTKHDPSERPNATDVMVVLHAHRSTKRRGRSVSPPKQKPPERCHLLGSPARASAVQWYVGEQGEAALKHVFDELKKSADGDVDMSRNKVTQDVSMSFIHNGQGWEIKFPLNFPRSEATLSSNGEERGKIGGDTVEIAIRRMISVLAFSVSPPLPDRQIIPPHKDGDQWYFGDQGEADLKYVFDELTRIADGEVKMSRKTDMQDITMDFKRQGQTWKVKLPSNFPRSKASLIKDEEEHGKIGGDNVIIAANAIVSRISSTMKPAADWLPAIQWYDGDEGEAALKYVYHELNKIADGEVKMSRNQDTQDVKLGLKCQRQTWKIKFPSSFPRSYATLNRNGEECGKVGGNSVETATSAIINHITGHLYAGLNEDEVDLVEQPAGAQWYAGHQGEAALKYVHDELTQIADDDVGMSRSRDTHDVTLSFVRHGQQWQVKFPSNFPSSNARLIFDGDVYAKVGGNTLESAVSAIKNRITSVDEPTAQTVYWKAVSCVTN